jgi:hypothetical protein
MGIQPADSAARRPKQCNISGAAARRWLVSATMFLWNLIVETKDISTASIKDLCLYIKGAGLLNLR